jgi:predicted lipoprotein with Yx(FWY)xxD motif
MRHHLGAIFGGAIALSALSALGAGAGAATPATPAPAHGGSTMNPSRVAAVQTVSAQGISKSATLHTATATVGGKTESILVNVNGLPLYYFRSDTAKKSLVTGELARLWPPLLSAKPTATGIQGALTALKEPNGQQVAFNGHFLYTFVADIPGHVTGQGVSNFFVATPRLKTITSAKTTPTPPAATSGGGYGY